MNNSSEASVVSITIEPYERMPGQTLNIPLTSAARLGPMGAATYLPHDGIFLHRVAVAERLQYVHQLLQASDDEDLIAWIRNRLQEPYAYSMKRLRVLNPKKWDKDLRK